MLFHIEKPITLTYFCSYVFLGVVSLAAFLILLLRKRFLLGRGDLLVKLAALYSGAILFWSVLISALDLSRGNYPIVFLTVMMAVASLNLLTPPYFGIISWFGTIVILVLRFSLAGFDGGLCINIIVFYIVSVLICIRNYQMTVRDYENAKHLRALSYSDELTGLYNRRSLDEKVKDLIELGLNFYLIMGDIDCFKEINDIYGHGFGDECIRLISKKLQDAFENRVYRYGGDEIVILSDKPIEEIKAKLKEFTDGITVRDATVHMSFGISAFHDGVTEQILFRTADKLLYQGKRNGRRQIAIDSSEEN